MRRREFIAGLALPLLGRSTWAQQAAPPVIGFLSARSPGESEAFVAAFRRGLGESDFVEGKNISIAFRWAEGRYEQLPTLAAELVGLRVAVIVAAGGTPSALAAKGATSTIPVVFSGVGDPVGVGLVASLNRPGANATGMSTFHAALAKDAEFLKDVLPKASVIAYLSNPLNPNSEGVAKESRLVASALGLQFQVLDASSEEDIERAFESLAALHADGLMIPGEPFFDSRREKIVALSARYRVAAIYPWRDYVEAGGLMSYGPSLIDSYRQAGVYVGRILKGEKPGDLPVLQPTRFELVINLKTAKALGLKISPTLLARADEVIE